MARINDVGGMYGFGAIVHESDHPGLSAVWEAETVGLMTMLIRGGLVNADEVRFAIERIDPANYLSTEYYARWLLALERLVEEKGLLQA